MSKKSSGTILGISRERIQEIIFEANTPEGKWFDILLLFFILLSVLTVMLETVNSLSQFSFVFVVLEWFFTLIFTIEYVLRIYSVYRPKKYVLSFYGIIDLLAILPTYISLFIVGTQSLAVIRALRLMRIFRIFKMWHLLQQAAVLSASIKAARAKIFLFLYVVIILVCIFGSIMYLVEGGVNERFDSIPRSIYWAIVTLTTVGYGDIAPVTVIGQFLSAIVMIIGYAVIAVPTGIVSAEFVKNSSKSNGSNIACRYCSKEGHEQDATFCKFCGEELHPETD